MASFRNRKGRLHRPARRLGIQSLEARWALSGTGQIAGTLWQDQNANGARELNENGVADQVVFLDANDNGQFDSGEQTATTGADGGYVFTGLSAGTYHVGAVAPQGWTTTYPNLVSAPLTHRQTLQNGIDGISGIQGAEAVVSTADGRHVYVASILNNTVTLFNRDAATGTLMYSQTYQDGVGGVDGLLAAHFIGLSPDEKFAYVAGRGDDAVAVFSRDATSGALTFVQVIKQSSATPGLRGASYVEVSPDGKNLYVAGRFDNAVVVFRRNEMTGELTYIETKKNGVSGVTGLDDVRWLATSPDGRSLYACSLNDNALVVFDRNEITGRLTLAEVHRDGVNGVNGLLQAGSVIVSHDGKSVYVAGSQDDAIAVFSRDTANGRLTFKTALVNNQGGITGLDGVIALGESANDRYIYAAGFFSDTLVVFQRDPNTGDLSVAQVLVNNVDGVAGLDGSHGISQSFDGRHLYVGGYLNNSVSTFALPPRTQSLNLAMGQSVASVDFGVRDGAMSNRPPRLTLIGNRTIDEGSTLDFIALASDPDHGDKLRFRLSDDSPADASILPILGAFAWTPQDSSPAPVPVTVLVDDGAAVSSSDFETFQVTVRNVVPVANVSGPFNAQAGSLLSFTLSASDISPVDFQAGFQYEVDWNGDNVVDSTIAGSGEGVGLTHTFFTAGNFLVQVFAVDKDGGRSLAATQPVVVTGSVLAGDANADGQVGTADYAIWAAQFGMSGVGLSADFDRNGEVGLGDYAIWAANFGATSGGSASATPLRAAVPSAAAALSVSANAVQAVHPAAADQLHAGTVPQSIAIASSAPWQGFARLLHRMERLRRR